MGINSGKNSIKLSKFNLILYDLNTNGGELSRGWMWLWGRYVAGWIDVDPAESSKPTQQSESLHEIIFVLNANFDENINAHYQTHKFSMSLCPQKYVQMTKNTYMSW